jgi:hypothetical protein
VERLVERLTELGADRKIVAVTGLDTSLRRPRGNLNYLTFIALREWFPHARWVGGTQLMDEVRLRKSAEEIQMLQNAVRCAEAALKTAGLPQASGGLVRERWADALRMVIGSGGDPSSWVEIMTDPADGEVVDLDMLDRPLALARLFELAILARFEGYGALAIQPALVGPVESIPRAAMPYLVETWNCLFAELRPGRTWSEVAAHLPARAGFSIAARIDGMGLGDDLPVSPLPGAELQYLKERTLVEGVSFALDVQVIWREPERTRRLRWADTLVLTTDGPQRLGERPVLATSLP